MPEATNNPFNECRSLLTVLERKAFYRDRFLAQVSALFPEMHERQALGLAPTLYLNGLIQRIASPDTRSVAIELACKRVVNSRNECPSPAEVRQFIAESALDASGVTFQSLYERAKNFLARPPVSQVTADRWLEQVIYTAVRRVSHERFALIPPEEWRFAVTEVMLNDTIKLVAYQVVKKSPAVVTFEKRNYKGLIDHG